MFAGIVREVGRVKSIAKKGSLTKLGVSSTIIYEESELSHSIALNGVCLTLIYKKRGVLFFEAVKSTLDISNLKRLRQGDYVNLEPSLKLQDKLGGHFVLGHIDGEVKLSKIVTLKGYWQLTLNFSPLILRKSKRLIVENGSVALEGISLTVKKKFPSYFTVDIIPFTYKNTNLRYKRVGDWLNIEFDYLLKQTSSLINS
jgi:riboflavin synthase